MKGKWTNAFQVAAVYVGTVVGAGFATGKEIVEFFSRFGFFGFIAILITGYLLAIMGAKLMIQASRIQAKSYQEFNEYLFGKWPGTVVNVIMLLMLLGVSSVMLSGAGAVFEEQLEFPKSLGIALTVLLSVIVMWVGMKAIFSVNTFVVPIMIAFCMMLMILSIRMGSFMEGFLFIPGADDGWKAVLAPFSYTAFNLALAQAVLVPVAAEIKDEQVLKWGGMLGGAALTFILIASHFTLIMLPDLQSYDIPMAIIMKQLASAFYWVYVLVIYGEIFTSVIGNIFGLERQLRKYASWPTMLNVTVIFAFACLVSLVDYGTLLSVLYPLFGYGSLIFLTLLWMKPTASKKK